MIARWIARRIYRRMAIRRNVTFAPDLKIGRGCFVTAPDRLTIGAKVSIGEQCWIGCNGRIGDGVLISSYVGIAGRRDHDMKDLGAYMSESQWIFDLPASARDDRDSIDIGDDVWVGFGAIIMSGLTIGRGAVVGAGAVVSKNVPPYAIVTGNPARQVGERFNSQDRLKHEEMLRAKDGSA